MTTPENLEMNDAAEDATSSDKRKLRSGFGIEVVKSSENTGVVDKLRPFESALSHDAPITVGQVLEVEKTLDSMKISIDGEEVMLGDIRDDPDWEKNVEIWKKIQGGNFRTCHKLTRMIPHIAQLLVEHFDGRHINLNDITSVSDAVAEALSKYRGDLGLSGLTFISDTVAEHLSKHQGRLYLQGLISISNNAAEHLSKHQGEIGLGGLVSISDSVAEHLSKLQSPLGLNGLQSISDSVAEFLSKRPSTLSLDSLTFISDVAAEYLSNYQGTLFLRSLTSISDIAAKHLAKHKHLSLSAGIDAKIEEFREFKS